MVSQCLFSSAAVARLAFSTLAEVGHVHRRITVEGLGWVWMVLGSSMKNGHLGYGLG